MELHVKTQHTRKREESVKHIQHSINLLYDVKLDENSVIKDLCVFSFQKVNQN